jgi:uncharacterized protein YoxC
VEDLNSTTTCGENTTIKGIALGTIVGGVTAKVLQQSTLIGAAIGGIIGTIGGYHLAKVQCEYKGKEAILLQKIQSTINNQNDLTLETSQLNSRISELYKEIQVLQTQQTKSLNKKEELLSQINFKKEEVLKLQALSHSVKLEITQYYKDLKTSKYSENDTKNIEHSLESLIVSLHSIEESSLYNLEQLDKFEKRVNRV